MISSIKQLPNERIVVISLANPIDNLQDPPRATQEFLAIMGDSKETYVRILDFTNATPNFSDVVLGLASDPALKLDNVYSFMVGSHEMVAFAAQAATGQEQYGMKNVRAYLTLEEGLASAREILGK